MNKPTFRGPSLSSSSGYWCIWRNSPRQVQACRVPRSRWFANQWELLVSRACCVRPASWLDSMFITGCQAQAKQGDPSRRDAKNTGDTSVSINRTSLRWRSTASTQGIASTSTTLSFWTERLAIWTALWKRPLASDWTTKTSTGMVASCCCSFQRACPIEAPDIPRAKSHIPFPVLRSCQRIRPFPRPVYILRNKYVLRWGVGSPRPTPKLEGHPRSAFSVCLFSIFAATHHIWRPSPLSATRGRAMPWWHGTHLTWGNGSHVYVIINLNILPLFRSYFILPRGFCFLSLLNHLLDVSVISEPPPLKVNRVVPSRARVKAALCYVVAKMVRRTSVQKTRKAQGWCKWIVSITLINPHN
jgi:hypothetical protein